MKEFYEEYAQLARLSLEKKEKEIIVHIKKNLKNLQEIRPELAERLKPLISKSNNLTNISRSLNKEVLPIDHDTKLELMKSEKILIDKNLIWPDPVQNELNAVIEERKKEEKLIRNGLHPTKSIIFVGPPGVGKTLAAKWLSFLLGKPLLTLDIAAVMSSYLGRTGNNIRATLNYAQNNPCILLLDEFDSIAKKRGDESEIGELKRLVTVLLQAIDEWPSNSLLIAATNHPELLDPAIWRRFERIIEFPNPSFNEIRNTIKYLFSEEEYGKIEMYLDLLAHGFDGYSFSDITKYINQAKKESIVLDKNLGGVLEELSIKLQKNIDRNKRVQVGVSLLEKGFSQRRASEITGVSRDTLRKYKNEFKG